MAGLTFDTTGITIPTASELRAAWVEIIDRIFSTETVEANTDPEQPLGQVIDAIDAEIVSKNAEVAFLANQYSRKQATGAFLDALNSLYFLKRKTAAATVVQCQCTGAAGTRIPFGAIVSDTDGRKFRCLSVNSVIGTSGTALIDFAAVEIGALSVQAGTVTRIITTVPGWDSVTNPAAGVVGRLRESDAEFRDRAAASVAANAHGTVDAIRSAIAAIDGVIDCEVLENYTNEAVTLWGVSVPGHSICVCVSGGEAADIARAIYQKKDAGCGTYGTTTISHIVDPSTGFSQTYKIIRPTATAVYVKCIFARALSEGEQDKVRAAIVADATGAGSNARIGCAEKLYASRFWQAIADATDAPMASVTVRLGSTGNYADSVTINANVEPVVSAETIVIEAEA